MKVNITTRLVKEFLKKHPNEEMDRGYLWHDDSRVQSLDIGDFTEEELATLFEIADAHGEDKTTFGIIRAINALRAIKKDPGGKKVAQLNQLEKAQLSKQDWDDVADLLEQAGVMAEDSTETHTKPACRYVRHLATKLALDAQDRANQL